MRDSLFVGDQLVAEFAVNVPGGQVKSFQLSYEVGTEEDLRGLLDQLGGIELFLPAGTTTGNLLACTYGLKTVEGRNVAVYIWLKGEDFPPPAPVPLGVVERIVAEAEAEKARRAAEEQREADAEVVGPHDLTAGEVRSWAAEEPVLP